LKRVFISRIGVLSSMGTSTEIFWQNLLAGKSNASPLGANHFAHLLPAELKMPATSENNFIGEWNALVDALLTQIRPSGNTNTEIDGILWASGQHGFKFGDAQAGNRSQQLTSVGVAAGFLSRLPTFGFNLGSPPNIIGQANGCVSGISTLEEAFLRIRENGWARALVVVAEARVRDWLLWPYYKMGLLSSSTDQRLPWTRSFAKDRDGFVKGEGATILLVESESHLTDEPYCEVRVASSWPGGDQVFVPPQDIAKPVRKLQDLTAQVGLRPSDMGYINLYGSGSRLSDDMEVKILADYLGENSARVPVSALKGHFGHLNTAAAALELAATALSIKHQVIIPTFGLKADNAVGNLNFICDKPISCEIKNAVKLAFGFGWISGAAILSKA